MDFVGENLIDKLEGTAALAVSFKSEKFGVVNHCRIFMKSDFWR